MQKMIELSNSDDIKTYQRNKKAQIWDSFNKATEDSKSALLITKGEFEEKYPTDKFEHYSLAALTRFREDLMKAEGIENKDQAFKEAAKDLKHFVVVDNTNKKHIVFVREKQKGE